MVLCLHVIDQSAHVGPDLLVQCVELGRAIDRDAGDGASVRCRPHRRDVVQQEGRRGWCAGHAQAIGGGANEPLARGSGRALGVRHGSGLKRGEWFLGPWPGPPSSSKDLGKRYGDFIALHPLDVTVHEGEFFGVFGPNGAGNPPSSSS